MSETALAVVPPREIDITSRALSIEKIMAQRGLIEQAMNSAMKEGQHYGTIPGCGDKPTLMQPGAQLLAYLFQLRPEYQIHETRLGVDHVEFRIDCILYFKGVEPAIEVGRGVGICSTMESKYRYRNAAAVVEETNQPVPPMYWDTKKKEGPDVAAKWLAKACGYETHEGLGVKKFATGWQIVWYRGGEGKVENPNIADTLNTVLKIAKKRSYVDSVITATASSDFFTQDLEDIRDNLTALDADMKKAEARATTSSEKSEAGEKLTSWRDVVIHFGKADGPLKGKRLGDLPDDTIDWLNKKMSESTKKLSKDDERLFAAVKIAIAERDPQQVGDGKAGDFIPGLQGAPTPQFHGPKHEELFNRLTYDGIEVPELLEALKENKAVKPKIPKDAIGYDAVSEALAGKLLEEIAPLIETIKVNRPKSGTPEE